MTELINSFKIFATGTPDPGRRLSQGLQNIPLVTIGRADSCNESGFNQWRDAMRMVARLPGGLPPEFRIRLWENLADRYLQERGLDWNRVLAKCRSLENPRDEDIADQIDKDLHRTGCTGFSGAKQAVLKRVLVAYAKWNPQVGYCQGFNMIGAMLLQMTQGNEPLTLKIFVFLIEGVLPQGYFSQGLRGLAIDMAVFRDLLRMRKPTLNAHLTKLQKCDENPPLTDVFTMHWFLTLFIHCLPTPSVLRIWDLVLLEGSEVLLRAALVLWAAIETRILGVSSADEFYSVMGVVTREMLEFGLMDPNTLVKCVVSVGPFPFPGLEELRQKHRALIAKDTPYKSFFLAKRELDNLKRHYSAMKHRQKGSAIMHNLKVLDTKIIPSAGKQTSRITTSLPVKKSIVVSPKPRPRRTNSGSRNNLNNIHNSNNNKSISRQDTAERLRQVNRNNASKSSTAVTQQTSIDKGKQVTVPWNMISKQPKKFRKRATSGSSMNTSSSTSSSSTELCDSDSDEDVDDDDDDNWGDMPKGTKKEHSPVPPPPPPLPSIDVSKESGETAASTVSEVPKIEIKGNDEDEPPPSSDSPIPMSPAAEPIKENDKKCPISVSRPTTTADLGLDLHLDLNDTGNCIDAGDSQRFLEEMSRLGKSDSFYESLSNRICQLQFQNLRTLTTCTTIPDPVIMPAMEYSPLPSPMSPYPRTPISTSTTPSAAMLSAPQFTGKLVLSPSLNHLSLSTSPRGSISGPPASQPGTPGQERLFSGSSRSSSRRPSRSSLSSVDNEDGVFPVGERISSKPTLSSSRSPSRRASEEHVSKSETSQHSMQTKDSIDSVSEIPLAEEESLEVKPEGSSSLIFNNDDEEVTKEVEEEGDENFFNFNSETQTELGAVPGSEDICSVIRENLAILQRLKLKPAGEDSDSNDSWSTSSISELSDAEDIGGSSTGTNDRVGISGNSIRIVPVVPRRRSLSRCVSSESASAGEGSSSTRKSSLNRANTVCSNCSRGTPRRGTTQGPAISSSVGIKAKSRKNFNPFPTARKARSRTTKFGLYS